jgi:fatty acid synthase
MIQGRQNFATPFDVPRPSGPALQRLTDRGEARVLVSFGGQGQPYIRDLEELHRDDPRARDVIEACAAALADEAGDRDGTVELPIDTVELARWITRPTERPADRVLQAAPISYPAIFISQVARLVALEPLGLAPNAIADWSAAVTGHSQGIIAAWLAARGLGHDDLLENAVRLTRFMFRMGARKQAAWGYQRAPSMAEVSGLPAGALDRVIQGFEGLVCQIHNSPRRHVVSGPADQVERFCRHLEVWRASGTVPRWVSAVALPCTAPFHSPYLACAVAPLLRDALRLGVHLSPDGLVVPLLHYEDGMEWRGEPNLIESLCSGELDWSATLRAACDRGITHVVDVGPHDAMAKLTTSIVEGRGVLVVSAATAEGRDRLSSIRGADLSTPEPWRDRGPRLVATPDGRTTNAFTRHVGRPPVLFCTFSRTRPEQRGELHGAIDTLLSPELGRTFSAWCVDPEALDRCARLDEAAPDPSEASDQAFGVSVDVGLGQVDEMVALLKALEGFRLRLCSLAVDDDAHLVKALTIADNLPDSTLILHVGGGRNGWRRDPDELEELLLRWYSRIRVRSNLLLAVHGGAELLPMRARVLLSGAWSEEHGFPPMPVDAVFIDAEVFACIERESPASRRAASPPVPSPGL